MPWILIAALALAAPPETAGERPLVHAPTPAPPAVFVHAPGGADLTCAIQARVSAQGRPRMIRVDGCPGPLRALTRDAVRVWRWAEGPRSLESAQLRYVVAPGDEPILAPADQPLSILRTPSAAADAPVAVYRRRVELRSKHPMVMETARELDRYGLTPQYACRLEVQVDRRGRPVDWRSIDCPAALSDDISRGVYRWRFRPAVDPEIGAPLASEWRGEVTIRPRGSLHERHPDEMHRQMVYDLSDGGHRPSRPMP